MKARKIFKIVMAVIMFAIATFLFVYEVIKFPFAYWIFTNAVIYLILGFNGLSKKPNKAIATTLCLFFVFTTIQKEIYYHYEEGFMILISAVGYSIILLGIITNFLDIKEGK